MPRVAMFRFGKSVCFGFEGISVQVALTVLQLLKSEQSCEGSLAKCKQTFLFEIKLFKSTGNCSFRIWFRPLL